MEQRWNSTLHCLQIWCSVYLLSARKGKWKQTRCLNKAQEQALLLPFPLGPGTTSRQWKASGKQELQSHSWDETRKGKKRAESQGERSQLRRTNGWESRETGLRDDSASGGKGCLEMGLAVPAPWGSWGSTCLEAIYSAVSMFLHRLWMHPSSGSCAVHRVLFPSPGYCWISGFFSCVALAQTAPVSPMETWKQGED